MTNHVDFTYFRHTSRSSSLRNCCGTISVDRQLVNVERRQAITDTARLRPLKDQSFVGIDVGSDFGDVWISLMTARFAEQ